MEFLSLSTILFLVFLFCEFGWWSSWETERASSSSLSFLLYILTDICKRQAGLLSSLDPRSSSSDPNLNMAFSLASQFNLFSIMVIMKLPFLWKGCKRYDKNPTYNLCSVISASLFLGLSSLVESFPSWICVSLIKSSTGDYYLSYTFCFFVVVSCVWTWVFDINRRYFFV